MTEKKITAEELDKKFDDGEEDVLQYADLTNITKRVNVDFPSWIVRKLDEEAKRVGGSRQALIRQIVVSYIDERMRIELEIEKLKAKAS